MASGYFLDFSNSSLEKFVADSVDIELYSEKYDLGSGSKANRMRAIWDLEPNHLVGKLIREIIEDDDDKILFDPHCKKRNQELRAHCLQIVQRLEMGVQNGNVNITTPAFIQSNTHQSTYPPVPQVNATHQPPYPPVSQVNANRQPPYQSAPKINATRNTEVLLPIVPKPTTNTVVKKNKVFIVHGHDELAKEKVARFIAQVGLEPVILHEQASSSRTIIEKIEAYAEQVCFAVVLYTPCDHGSKIGMQELSSRARQNVVFEHGYFIAKLGRENVTAIVKGCVETPNDFSGVVYVSFDESGAWKLDLAKEMKASGCKIDINNII